MNEAVDKALQSLILKATDSAEAIITLVGNETPIVVQQLLQWNIIRGALFILALTLVILIIQKYVRVINKRDQNDDRDISLFLLNALSIIIGAFATSFLMSIIKIIYFPKLWLVEYLRTMT